MTTKCKNPGAFGKPNWQRTEEELQRRCKPKGGSERTKTKKKGFFQRIKEILRIDKKK